MIGFVRNLEEIIYFFLGKCECKGILIGSNVGIMVLDFDLEVRF